MTQCIVIEIDAEEYTKELEEKISQFVEKAGIAMLRKAVVFKSLKEIEEWSKKPIE